MIRRENDFRHSREESHGKEFARMSSPRTEKFSEHLAFG